MIKRITSKEEEEKKKHRNQIVVGIVLIFVMVLSTLGYSFMNLGENQGNTGESVTYKGTQFILTNGFWTLKGNQNLAFQYNPIETQNLSIPSTANLGKISDYTNKVVYITSESGNAENEINRNLYSFVQRTQDACLPESYGIECKNKNLPIKNCGENFIIIKEDKTGNASIRQEGKCVFISSSYGELTKASDEFLFRILGLD